MLHCPSILSDKKLLVANFPREGACRQGVDIIATSPSQLLSKGVSSFEIVFPVDGHLTRRLEIKLQRRRQLRLQNRWIELRKLLLLMQIDFRVTYPREGENLHRRRNNLLMPLAHQAKMRSLH